MPIFRVSYVPETDTYSSKSYSDALSICLTRLDRELVSRLDASKTINSATITIPIEMSKIFFLSIKFPNAVSLSIILNIYISKKGIYSIIMICSLPRKSPTT